MSLFDCVNQGSAFDNFSTPDDLLGLIHENDMFSGMIPSPMPGMSLQMPSPSNPLMQMQMSAPVALSEKSSSPPPPCVENILNDCKPYVPTATTAAATPAAPSVSNGQVGGTGLFASVSKSTMRSATTSRASQAALAAVREEVARATPKHKIKKKAPKPTKAELAKMTDEERALRRRRKNREAAQLSRLRKRVKLETLEQLLGKEKELTSQLCNEREVLLRENNSLKDEVNYLKEVLRKSLSVANAFNALSTQGDQTDLMVPQPMAVGNN